MLTPARQSRMDRQRRGQRGSVVVAMAVIMLLMLVGIAAISQSQSQLRATATGSDAAAAEAGAEQGIAEAIARLDAGEQGDFSGEGELVGGRFRFKAAELSASSYFIYAEAEVDGVVRAIEATVGGQANSPYSLFIDTKADISYNDGVIAGRVATNGPINVQGTPPGDTVDLFGPSATCSACPSTTSYPDRRDPVLPVVPTGTTQDCPRDGVFTGTVSGRGGVPYVCDRSHVASSWVTFSDTVVVVDAPLVVFVRIGLDVRFRGADVNVGGDPNDFQLSAEGDDDYWWFDLWSSRVWGVLDAPGRDSILGDAEIVGQLNIGVLYVPSAYDASISAPAGLGGTSGGWTLVSWERVGSQ